jgi:hypothetical protein
MADVTERRNMKKTMKGLAGKIGDMAHQVAWARNVMNIHDRQTLQFHRMIYCRAKTELVNAEAALLRAKVVLESLGMK